jgi:predicted metal-dependent hydrolase
VAHEVTHLVHFDHSQQFYTLLGEIFEGDLKMADKWLKDHGRGLYTQFG